MVLPMLFMEIHNALILYLVISFYDRFLGMYGPYSSTQTLWHIEKENINIFDISQK